MAPKGRIAASRSSTMGLTGRARWHVSCGGLLRSQPTVARPHLHLTLSEVARHGAIVEAKPFADPCQRQPRLVETNHLVDLRVRGRLTSHSHLVLGKDVQHGPLAYAIPLHERRGRLASLVARHNPCDCFRAEAPPNGMDTPGGARAIGWSAVGHTDREVAEARQFCVPL